LTTVAGAFEESVSELGTVFHTGRDSPLPRRRAARAVVTHYNIALSDHPKHFWHTFFMMVSPLPQIARLNEPVLKNWGNWLSKEVSSNSPDDPIHIYS